MSNHTISFESNRIAGAVPDRNEGDSYLAVEELVAIVDTNSRKIVSVMQRMRRQEDSK